MQNSNFWVNNEEKPETGNREYLPGIRLISLAAIMNSYMPGGASLDGWLGGDALTIIVDTLTNGSVKAIRDLGSDLAGYNESGDNQALDPSLPPTGKTNNADPQGARKVGAPCEASWNTPEVTKGKGNNK